MSRAEEKRRQDAFVVSCRRNGLKVTPQRMEILRELARKKTHPDVLSVYQAVRKRIPAISLDTVYRTLHVFEEKAVIRRVGFALGKARFDANIAPHHHFVCQRCGFIGDVSAELLPRESIPSRIRQMGSVDSARLEFYGLCYRCQKEKK